jgi:hypothetical protein
MSRFIFFYADSRAGGQNGSLPSIRERIAWREAK